MQKLDSEEFEHLISRLRLLPAENQWVEFKENNESPDLVGKLVSSLSNSAAIAGEPMGFAVWGITDSDHEITGTKFRPFSKKIGNEDFIPWLHRLVSPQIEFEFQEGLVGGKQLVLMRISAARSTPTRFKNEGFVRVGSYVKELKLEHDLERQLFRSFETFEFEEQLAQSFLEPSEIVQLIDYPSFFKLNGLPLPEKRSEVVDHLDAAGVVTYSIERNWSITNLGALLYATDLRQFSHLKKKIPRVVIYKGDSRIETLREFPATGGYATIFTAVIDFVENALPMNEVIQSSGIRESVPMIPRLVIRCLLYTSPSPRD